MATKFALHAAFIALAGCAVRHAPASTPPTSHAVVARSRATQDRDGDGVPDPRDHCPDAPEDRDGVQDNDGCPESETADRDGDGIADNADRCPDDPEDRDSFQDEEGCPEPDNDNDRVADALDRCPDAPEVYNGNADDDGCPDEVVDYLHGHRTIQIRDAVRIPSRTHDLVTGPENAALLDRVAALMIAQPDIELLEVEGHTDERDDATQDLARSREYAEVVVRALVARGVAPSRLVAAGYGGLCPVSPRRDVRSRGSNRRVTFVIARVAGLGRTSQRAGCRRGATQVPASVGSPQTALE